VELAIREFLAFKFGDEEYGIDIVRVQEIRSFEKPPHMANAQLTYWAWSTCVA
jgi:purine-binding chemotaxis protein CheW